MKLKNIVIGAGPAGIQMADLLRDEDYLILEKADVPCSFFHHFPRHRKFISLNKSRNLRYDWNSFLGGHLSFRDYSEEMYPHVDDYIRYVNDFIKLRDIKIKYKFEVTSLEKRDDVFYINGGEYTAERVFFGIGIIHKKPDQEVPKDLQVYTYANMPLDKEIYRNRNIIIVGGGNAAYETVKWLEPFCDKIIVGGTERKAWQTHYPGHLRSVNFHSLDSYYFKANLLAVWEPHIKLENYLKFVDNPIIIFCHGFEFNSELVKDLVDVDKFPIILPNFESSKCKNLFFIGSNSQRHDYKKGTSAFIHGFRYNCQYLARYLKGQLVFKSITNQDELVHTILHTLNTSSSLFHRFDFFCILLAWTGTLWEYLSDIPISTIPSYNKPEWKIKVVIRLGYENHVKDKFMQARSGLPIDAPHGVFIHPIIETSQGYKMHLAEEEFNEWAWSEGHVKPLSLYLDFIKGLKTTEELTLEIEKIRDRGEKLKQLYS